MTSIDSPAGRRTSATARTDDAEGLRALAAACDLPLSIYRDAHRERQLDDVGAAAGAESLGELGRLVRADPELRRRLRARIANSLTGPFRDREQFELLERELLPPLLARGGGLRVWSAGCSDGSELFSLATVLERAGALADSRLLGSDILPENLERARAAAARMPSAQAARFRWECRELSGDGPPPGRWDVVLCRNVGIYLRSEPREAMHRTLAAALAPDGVLMLGRSERLAAPGRHGLVEVAPHAYRRAS